MEQKNKNVKKIIAVLIGIILIIIFFLVLFFNKNDNVVQSDKVMNENGEASFINMTIPQTGQKKDSTNIIDKLEKIRQDSIENLERIKNGSGLNNTNVRTNQQVNQAYNTAYGNNTPVYSNTKTSSNRNTNLKANSKSHKSKNTYVDNEDYTIPNDFDTPITQKNSINTSTSKTKSNSSFFKKSNEKQLSSSTKDITIFACVHTNQIIKNNERIKLRTTKEFVYNGKIYPINTIIYGLALIKPNRLIIDIKKINQTDVDFKVFDSEDSELGIYVLTPNLNEALKAELKKEGLDDDDLSRIPFSKTLKNIFEKKVRDEKVQLINNYKVLIKNEKDI